MVRFSYFRYLAGKELDSDDSDQESDDDENDDVGTVWKTTLQDNSKAKQSTATSPTVCKPNAEAFGHHSLCSFTTSCLLTCR